MLISIERTFSLKDLAVKFAVLWHTSQRKDRTGDKVWGETSEFHQLKQWSSLNFLSTPGAFGSMNRFLSMVNGILVLKSTSVHQATCLGSTWCWRVQPTWLGSTPHCPFKKYTPLFFELAAGHSAMLCKPTVSTCTLHSVQCTAVWCSLVAFMLLITHNRLN